MSRRRLRVVASSSDEDDDEQHAHENQTHSQIPHQSAVGQPQAEEEDEILYQFEDPLPEMDAVALDSSSAGPIQQPEIISDDDDEDFIDVAEHFNPPSPPPPPPPHIPPFQNSVPASSIPSSNGGGPSHSAVSEVLRSLGLNLKAEWLDSCVRGLETAVPGFSGLDSETKAKFCFEQFLNSDMNFAGGGVLPPNLDSMHLVELPGPFILQVDETVNISCALRERYKNAAAGPKRCLKLSMTDGFQRVFGMEYRPITDLQVLAPAGFKVAIKNVTVRHGLLMLVPEVLEVLGGSVQDLEAARQRLVFEINKPPRGRRTRHGELPPLATRAAQAAWPQNVATNPVENNTSAQHSNNSTGQDVQGAQHSNNSTRQHVQDAPQSNNSTRQDGQGAQRINNSTRQGVQGSAFSGSGIHTRRTTEDSVVIPASTNADGLPTTRDTTDHPRTRESTELSTSRMAAEGNFESTTTVQNVQDVDMADPADPLFMLSGDRELPFTYLASLLAKWASVKGKQSRVQGKIKGFVTSVTGFQYKGRETFVLRVYVEDGSLITEALVHHSVVQNFIGFSPEEVTAAMTSSDIEKVTNMRKVLIKMQTFLEDFEGILMVELNESSDLPIAIEMNQGCPASDACSLLNRCLSFDSPNANSHLDPRSLSNRSDPIVLSP